MQPVAQILNVTLAALVGHRVSAATLLSLPDISITLAGGVTLIIPPRHYFTPMPGYGDECYLLIVVIGFGNILGQPVHEAYYTVYDQENHRVGFAPIAGCPSVEPPSCAAGVRSVARWLKEAARCRCP